MTRIRPVGWQEAVAGFAYKMGRISRTIGILVLSAILAMSLIACTSLYPDFSTLPVVSTEREPNSDEILNQQRGDSGPLRVWWTPVEDLNPLLNESRSGQAANDLIFEGLLSRQEDGRLERVLAESLAWSQDGLVLTIRLTDLTRFHNGQILTSADAAQSLAFIWSIHGGPEFDLNQFAANPDETDPDETDSIPENDTDETDQDDNEIDNEDNGSEQTDEDSDSEEPDPDINQFPLAKDQFAAFSQLEQINLIDSLTFECIFSEPVENFLAYLTFPIVPIETWTREDPLTLVNGTGRFRMDRLDEQGNLWLTAIAGARQGSDTKPDAPIRSVVLKPYRRINEAMRALEFDELDLVLLEADQYPYYFTRNNLALQRFPENRSVFLAMNTERGRLTEPGLQLALKHLLSLEERRQRRLVWPGEMTDVPLSYTMIQYDPRQSDYNSILDQTGTKIEPDQIEQPLSPDVETEPEDQLNSIVRLIVPERDYLMPVASSVAALVDEVGLTADVAILPDEAYTQALSTGEYDLALCEATLADNRNPAWLYGPNGLVNDIDQLSMQGLSDYSSLRLQLSWYDVMWHQPADTDGLYEEERVTEFSQLLTELAAKSPFCHMYIPYGALAYGDRINGQSRPNEYHPYEGIEELWVWSG